MAPRTGKAALAREARRRRIAAPGYGCTAEVECPALRVGDDLDDVRDQERRSTSRPSTPAYRSRPADAIRAVRPPGRPAPRGIIGSSPCRFTTTSSGAQPARSATSAMRSVPGLVRQRGHHDARSEAARGIGDSFIVGGHQDLGGRRLHCPFMHPLQQRLSRQQQQRLAGQARGTMAGRDDDAEHRSDPSRSSSGSSLSSAGGLRPRAVPGSRRAPGRRAGRRGRPAGPWRG